MIFYGHLHFMSIHFGIWIVFLMINSCQSLPVYHSRQTIHKNQFGESSSHLLTQDQKDALLKEIELWKGTPYRFGMVDRGKGTDCSGFVGYVYKKIFHVDLPRQAADMALKGTRVSKNDLRFGDLVFLKNTYKGAKGASHVGIFIGNNKMAHASTTEGVTISDLTEKYYVNHYDESRRVIR
jgi:cell wall-associated NlpC family hydrolase